MKTDIAKTNIRASTLPRGRLLRSINELHSLYSLIQWWLRLLHNYPNYKKYSSFLKKSQWWSEDRLREYQTNKLKEMVQYAYRNVPYYNRLFKKEGIKPASIRGLEDLEKIPALTKETLSKNFKRFISRKHSYGSLIKHSTSGTTGAPLKFAYSQDYYDIFLFALRMRHYNYNKSRFYQKSVQFGGSLTSVINKGENFLYKYDAVRRVLHLSASNLSSDVLPLFTEQIRKHRPSFMRGTAYAVYQLALFLKEKGIRDISFNSFTNYGEMLLDHQKEVIKKQLNCEVYNYYSQIEEVCSAMDCSKHEGMHVDMEKGIIEVIKDRPSQKTGRIVATCLQNYAVPLIRYETGDMARILKKSCSCGRGLELIDNLEGREDDLVIVDGRLIAPPEFSVLVRDIPHIKECQFIQEEKNHIVIWVVKNEGYTDKDTRRLLGNSSKLMGKKAKVSIEFEKEIKRSKSGKFQFVISKLKS